jgi:hypothetical protein
VIWMGDTNALTTLSDAHYLQTLEYKAHVENMLASYDHPTGVLGELVSQMADAFWWVRVYRAEKDQLLITTMANELVQRSSFREELLPLWLEIYEIIAALAAGQSIDAEGRQLLEEVLESNGHNLDSLRAAGLRAARSSYEALDRLIERQLKNVKLLLQAYDSVRFAPQIHKKMALEIEQLEQQVKQAREDQRLEVDRQ